MMHPVELAIMAAGRSFIGGFKTRGPRSGFYHIASSPSEARMATVKVLKAHSINGIEQGTQSRQVRRQMERLCSP